MRVLLIDNHDSFTFNLYQQIAALGARVRVVRNDEASLEDLRRERPTHLVLSPGPGSPEGAGISNDAIRAFAGGIPVLGVCLGHQCIGALYSPRGRKNVVHAPDLLHGKTSPVSHRGEGILRGMPRPFAAARYHSLMVRELPPGFLLMGSTKAGDGSTVIMGMMHETMPLFGVQFHPESFLTSGGDRIINNFLATNAS